MSTPLPVYEAPEYTNPPTAASTPADRQVGLALAFTGHFAAVRIIARFLELAGVRLVTSHLTTPAIMAAGTTLANSDFCLPLRVYVGHIAQMIAAHPDMAAVVAPNILSEDGQSSACAKHRDIGGVALRSLGDTIGYLLQHSGPAAQRDYRKLAYLVDNEALLARWRKKEALPEIIMPSVRSLAPQELFNLCYNIYADIMHWPRPYKAVFFLPGPLRRRGAAWHRAPLVLKQMPQLEHAFTQAYHEILDQRGQKLPALLAQPSQPRLGVVGRNYMVHDPALTCDLKTWFTRHGAAVITPADVPLAYLDRAAVPGFYDSHKEGQAFIDWALDKVDGFICLGSFGCHPDAFQIDYLANYARERGAACWTFRFDETTGSAGFHTRFETILAFLVRRRDQRLSRSDEALTLQDDHAHKAGAAAAGALADSGAEPVPSDPARRPILIWPYMGEVLNTTLAEVCWQLGVDAYPPLPLTSATLLAGNDRYVESCSPFACTNGSLKDSLHRLTTDLENGLLGEPSRRIVRLMLRGEGPCTFGWYALAQNKHLPEEFGARLAAGGHTLEMATMGMSNFGDFIRQVQGARTARLRPLLAFAAAWESGWERISWFRRFALCLRFFLALGYLSRPVFRKLAAAEKLRAAAMIRRAHELAAGTVTRAYTQALAALQNAHNCRQIARAERAGLALLAKVPQDRERKPRVVVVGEIYVALTSFANRGTTETLLGRHGVEIHEHVTLSRYIRSSLREMRRRAIFRVLAPVLNWFSRRNMYLLQERLREPGAKPFLVHEVGGEGVPSVAGARQAVEHGCDGILHLHPFKCMPEGIGKDALKELTALYGVGYLALSFDKEMEIERLRTEVNTFAALLHARVQGGAAASSPVAFRRERRRRQQIGKIADRLYRRYRRLRHCD